MVRVFHCADIHLDSPFSLLSPREAEAKRRELIGTFTSALIFAKSNGAQLFLISGDLFDSDFVSKDTKELLIKEFASLGDCRVFISPGNHDPYNESSPYKSLKFPDNVHVFGAAKECVGIDELGVDVYGVGFTSNTMNTSPVVGYHIKNPDRINILVCHGDTTNPLSTDGPITKQEIAGSGFDYIALGHIHKGTQVENINGVYYAYPGCILGRSFDETGYKGALFGTISKGNVKLDFKRFSARRYEIATIDLTGTATKIDAIERIRNSIKTYTNDTALRLILTGSVKEGFYITSTEIGKGMEFPYQIDIKDQTILEPDISELEEKTTLKGVFFHLMKDYLSTCRPGSDEYYEGIRAIKYGFAALDERNILDFGEEEQ